jgi:hypothetical protein
MGYAYRYKPPGAQHKEFALQIDHKISVGMWGWKNSR